MEKELDTPYCKRILVLDIVIIAMLFMIMIMVSVYERARIKDDLLIAKEVISKECK